MAVSTVATKVGVVTRKCGHVCRLLPPQQVSRGDPPLVVVVAGGEVGPEVGDHHQVGVPEPVHGLGDRQFLAVDLDQAPVGRQAEQEHHAQQDQGDCRGAPTEAGRVGQQPEAAIAVS
jgi:hypothetical protein